MGIGKGSWEGLKEIGPLNGNKQVSVRRCSENYKMNETTWFKKEFVDVVAESSIMAIVTIRC